MGLRQDLVSEGRIRLPAEFNRLIREHPLLRERFADARPLAAPETHRIPWGTARIRRSGSRVILAGDAAYLANPLTGGGIGNALLSGMIAGDVIKSCFRNNDFSDKALYLYDKVVNHFLRPRLEMEAEKQQQLYDDPCALDQMVKAASDDSENREALARLFFGSRYPEKSPGGVNPPRSDPST
jgi:flavin-dependent dehydrogenase